MAPRSAVKRIAAAGVVAAVAALAGCHDVDTDRIPYSPVRIEFVTIGDWHTYGVGGAAMARRFIRSREPTGFPYTAMSATGYGGVLLVGTYTYSGDPSLTPPAAFDLACPVEMRPDVRIAVDPDASCARCPKCGSTYDIFNGTGMPLGGMAATQGYGLRVYRCIPGGQGYYLAVSN